ncbi:unnamed protein product, partial [Discosporangium mesarthrocarpum]
MESTPQQAAEGKAIVTVLACVLNKLIQANASSGHDRLEPGSVTKFHALRPPGIGVAEYLERILKYSSCSNECFILGLIYMDRLIQQNNFALTMLNVHRVAITSVMVAAKFFDDAYYNNAYYAKVGGVPCHEMNSLEIAFLMSVKFNLHVSSDEYTKYRHQLQGHASSASCGCAGVDLPPYIPAPLTPPQQGHRSHNPTQQHAHPLQLPHQLQGQPHQLQGQQAGANLNPNLMLASGLDPQAVVMSGMGVGVGVGVGGMVSSSSSSRMHHPVPLNQPHLVHHHPQHHHQHPHTHHHHHHHHHHQGLLQRERDSGEQQLQHPLIIHHRSPHTLPPAQQQQPSHGLLTPSSIVAPPGSSDGSSSTSTAATGLTVVSTPPSSTLSSGFGMAV